MYSSFSARHQSQSSSVRRADLGENATHHREIALDGDAARALGIGDDLIEEDDDGRRLFIYGTRICVMTVKQNFLKFLQNYNPTELDADEQGMAVAADVRVDIGRDANYYMERLLEIEMTENPILNVNLKHVMEYDEDLYKMIIAYPAVSLPRARSYSSIPSLGNPPLLGFGR